MRKKMIKKLSIFFVNQKRVNIKNQLKDERDKEMRKNYKN